MRGAVVSFMLGAEKETMPTSKYIVFNAITNVDRGGRLFFRKAA